GRGGSGWWPLASRFARFAATCHLRAVLKPLRSAHLVGDRTMMTSSVFLVAAAVMMTQAPPQKPLARADLIKNINTHFQTIDTNHDGKVSPDEFRAADVTKFDKLDLNHDGIVTPDEARRANGGK